MICSGSDQRRVGCSINLLLADRLVVVVGGGQVGRRKAQTFLAAGANLRIVDPHGDALEWSDGCEVLSRAYQDGDLCGATLVVAATDNPQVNARVALAARASGVLVCLADDPSNGDFTLPAARQSGQLKLAVSTAGRSPALAAVLADYLLEKLEPEWPLVLELAIHLRSWQLTQPQPSAYNRGVLRKLIDRGLIFQLSARRFDLVDQLLQETCGTGCSLVALGLKLPRDYDR